jgi:hypothetical protein
MEGIQTIQALKAVQSSLPAQTTIPSDELVMLYAADGTPIAKIARDDLVKAVASVMASNSQTTFSKLLGVQANGTPMGIGASDLASVLGGSMMRKYYIYSQGEGTRYFKIDTGSDTSFVPLFLEIGGGYTGEDAGNNLLSYYKIVSQPRSGSAINLLKVNVVRSNNAGVELYYRKNGVKVEFYILIARYRTATILSNSDEGLTAVSELPSDVTQITAV